MRSSLQGIYPALVTPLASDGTLHIRSFEKLIERVYNAGVHGLYVCGSTGEGQSLPPVERRRIAEIAVKNSPAGKNVIVHVGAWSFDEARSLAQHAAGLGVAAVSSLRPAKTSFEELLTYYRDLAAASDVPFLAYHFPGPGEELSYGQLSRLTSLPNVIGLKFTDYDLFTLSSLVQDGRIMFNGRDEVLAAGLLLGAHGGIGSVYNLVPEEFVSLYTHAQSGCWAEARAVQDSVNQLIRVLLRFPFHAALKQALSWDGIECGPVLRPRLELSNVQVDELKNELAARADLTIA